MLCLLRRLLVVLALLTGALVAVGSASAAPGDAEPGAAPGSVPAIAWRPCPAKPAELEGLECARYRVPLDDAQPAGPTVELALSRRRATGPGPRVGSLFLNPGGPGGSGTALPASRRFRALGRRFDLIGFDPRGTGESTPAVRCTEASGIARRMDRAEGRPDAVSAAAAALRVGRAFARSCVRGTGALIDHVATADAARDLDRLRAAVGDERLTYLGFSYGTYLGTVYADLFPTRVRALTLDGAVDPRQYGQDFLGLLGDNYHASQVALGHFESWCARHRTSCRFGDGRPKAAFRRLVTRLDRHPLRSARGTANGYTVVYASYLLLSAGREGWTQLGRLLRALQDGRSATTNRLQLADLGIPSPNVTIECADSAGGVTPAGLRALGRRAARIAPDLGPALLAGPPSYDGANAATCAGWPRPSSPADWPGDFRAQGAPPILVVGERSDPSTPYQGAQALTRLLPGARLLTLDGEGHTSYSRSGCIRDAVDRYLTDGVLPAVGRVCSER